MLKTTINPKAAIILLVVFTIGSILLVNKESSLTKKEILASIESKLIKEGAAQEELSYVIDNGKERISYKITLLKNSTVFSLLKELAKRENFNIGLTIYPGMGVLVESIDGYKNGTDNKYWQYWANDQLPMVASDKKQVEGGEKIEWKFAPIPF